VTRAIAADEYNRIVFHRPSGSLPIRADKKPPFADVPYTHPSARAIDNMQRAKMFIGFPNGKFGPEVLMDRYACAMMLERGSECTIFAPPEGEQVPDTESACSSREAQLPFSDVSSDHWAFQAVYYTIRLGAMEVDKAGRFDGKRIVRLGELRAALKKMVDKVPASQRMLID
jgi:hypothetical protein